MKKLVVVDVGMGNLRSVAKAFEWVVREHSLPFAVSISDSPEQIREADRVVFPGQGAMPDCMRHLEESGLEAAIREAAASKPFFGVCVGMQMLFAHSAEGNTPGLGIFDGEVRRFCPTDAAIKVPHMGWNQVQQKSPHFLWQGIDAASAFYFVHSYYCEPADPALTVGETDYEQCFTAAIAQANIFATQFHPEKSQHAGLRLYQNFLQWQP